MARGAPGYREWQHFVVTGAEVEIIVNFSVLGDTGSPRGKVLLLVREAGWEGGFEAVAKEELLVRSGQIDARFGQSGLSFQGGAYHVHARLRSGLSVDLRLVPSGALFVANNLEIGGSGSRSWLVEPRLVAEGEIRSGGRVRSLRGALAYHDHNWGAWGGDLLWEWGFGLPDREGAHPWSFVFGRLLDAPSGRALMQSLFLWDGASLVRMFRDARIDVVSEGVFQAGRVLKVPPIMGLLHPGSLVDVPERLTIHARSGEDRLTAEFRAESMVELLIPRQEDLRTTEIDEVVGSVELRGIVLGRPVFMAGRGTFEFVHARS